VGGNQIIVGVKVSVGESGISVCDEGGGIISGRQAAEPTAIINGIIAMRKSFMT